MSARELFLNVSDCLCTNEVYHGVTVYKQLKTCNKQELVSIETCFKFSQRERDD